MKTPTLGLLRQAMTAYASRTRALAANVANLDTPGYQRVEVSFEEQLSRARRLAPSREDLAEVEPRTTVSDAAPVLEDELMELADTQMRQQLATRALTTHFGLLRTGITGRSF